MSLLFEIINVVVSEAKSEGRPDSNIFLWIVAYVADVAAANLNGIKSTFPIKGNTGFSRAPKSLPKDPPDCPILCSYVFHKFI